MGVPETVRQALAERYLIERELGRGGMGVVYLARDLRHDRPVPLKVLLPELAANGITPRRTPRPTGRSRSLRPVPGWSP